MKDRPILMNGQMVRATLADQKTKTRRIIKPQPEFGVSPISIDAWEPGVTAFNPGEFGIYREGWPVSGRWGLAGVLRCPYGQPGDALWLREMFCILDRYDWWDSSMPRDAIYNIAKYPRRNAVAYAADSAHDDDSEACRKELGYKWKPSIHMPRWASRITLEILSVKVERLQDITEEDAIAEGIQDLGPRKFGIEGWDEYCETAVDAFKILWESINGSWDANSWVWVVEFRRVKDVPLQ